MTIDLEKYRTTSGNTKSRVFTGRERGKSVREKSGIEDMFDKLMREGVASDKKIEIVIPDCVFSITPSFLEELFKEIVLKYGKEVVAKRIEFKGVYEIGIAFEEALDRIELQKNGLDV